MKKTFLHPALLFVTFYVLSGLVPAASSAQVPLEPVTGLYEFSNQLYADHGSLSRFYFVQNSPERRERFTAFFTAKKEALKSINFEQLSTNGQVDYLLLQRFIDNNLNQLAVEKQEYNQLNDWLDYGEVIYSLEKLRRRGTHPDSKKIAGDLTMVCNQVKDKTKKLAGLMPPFTPALMQRAKMTVIFHREALKSVLEFYDGYDPQFSWWAKQPLQNLDTALIDYLRVINNSVNPSLLPKNDGSGIIGNPIGKDRIVEMLNDEMIPYSPEELIKIANKEFEWCDKEVLRVTAEMGYGKDWKKALEKVKTTYVEEGHQPEKMNRLYDESISFLKQKDLLTIPPLAEETWRMTMLSAEAQKKSPFFLGGEELQIAFPTNEMEYEDKLMSMRGNNPHFARAVIHHELIAGHHLQMYSFNRHKPYRNYYTPFWVEGWALYWEMLLWDQGFAKTPEDQMGMLFWRKHRCARIIFSLNYHTGKWTPQECIDFLVDRVGHERANAEGEVRRSFTGGYGPLYQIAYMTGGLQFYALKKELVDTGKMSYKQFHDAILKENSMPVEMVRAILTNQILNRNYQTKWRFYDV